VLILALDTATTTATTALVRDGDALAEAAVPPREIYAAIDGLLDDWLLPRDPHHFVGADADGQLDDARERSLGEDDVIQHDARVEPLRARDVQLDRLSPGGRSVHPRGAVRRRDEVPAAQDAALLLLLVELGPLALALDFGIVGVWCGLLGLIASFFSIIFAYSRQTFALSRAGYLPRLLSITSGRMTPWMALIVPGVIGFLLALTGDGATLINIAVFGATISYALMMLSHIVLRQREPDLRILVSATEQIATRLRPGHLVPLHRQRQRRPPPVLRLGRQPRPGPELAVPERPPRPQCLLRQTLAAPT
jgi:hypothetical protein